VPKDEYEARIELVDQAFLALATTVDALTDQQAREPSLLPGWTRGHLITHLARNADGNWNIVEGAPVGEERHQYPGGGEQRVGEIERGANRSSGDLVTDLHRSQERLVSAWHRLTEAQWCRTGVWLAAGRRVITEGLRARRRELLVHAVDLDLGRTPGHLPNDFVEEERGWLVEHRTAETWPGVDWP
jgi:maleylpyruvate isomerase